MTTDFAHMSTADLIDAHAEAVYDAARLRDQGRYAMADFRNGFATEVRTALSLRVLDEALAR